MEIFLHPEAWIALVTLTFFEVVLGIDNIIFISIVSNRLPVEIRSKTRNMGLDPRDGGENTFAAYHYLGHEIQRNFIHHSRHANFPGATSRSADVI